MRKKILATLLSVAVAAPIFSVPAFAELDPSMIRMNQTFNDVQTGGVPSDLVITDSQVTVQDEGKENKSLYAPGGSSFNVRGEVGAFADAYVMSIKLKPEEGLINGSFGIATSKTAKLVELVKIQDNVIKTYDNNPLGSIKNKKYTDISIIMKDNVYFDVLVDGKYVIQDWSVPSSIKSGFAVFLKESGGENAGLYIDDFRVYDSATLYNNLPEAPYKKSEYQSLSVDTDVGDYEYFDSNDCYISPQKYDNVSFTPKTNTYVCGRFDIANPNRDNSITLTKSTTDDIYFDLTLAKGTFAHSTKKFSRFLIEGDYMTEKFDGTVQFMIRDKSTSAAPTAYLGMYSGGSLLLTNGSTITNIALNGQWFNLKLEVDIKTHTYNVYVNDVLKAENVPFLGTISQVDLFRFGFTTAAGGGTIHAKNMRVVGLEKGFEDGKEVKTAAFHNETTIKKFLEGTQAFHSYGEQMYVNGEKSNIDCIREDSELFVDADTLNKAFGLSLVDSGDALSGGDMTIKADGSVVNGDKSTTLSVQPKQENGKLYVPLTMFCREVLGKFVFYFETGIYIVSDDGVALDTSEWVDFYQRELTKMTVTSGLDELNLFLQYQRPEADKIKTDFTATAQAHPRVLATGEDFAGIRDGYKSNESLKYIVEYVLQQADKELDEPTMTYKFQDTFRQNLIAEEFMDRMMLLGFAWQITGDRKYFDSAYRHIESVASYPDYNTAHIIDTGYWNMGLAIAYDWFYDGYTEEQRTYVKDAILNKSLKEISDMYYGRISSRSPGSERFKAIREMTNYNAILNAGTMTAAVAIMDEAPDFCADALHWSLRSIEHVLLGLSPAGGWAESPSYWSMTMESILYAASTMQNAFGTDYGITNAKGVDTTLGYIISINGPLGVNNYHDCADSQRYVTYNIYMPLAKLLDDERGFIVRKEHLDSKKANPTVLDALFYDLDSTGSVDLEKLIVTDGVETFAFNENRDPNSGGLFLSGHFGNTGGYHSQNDTGTFVLDLLGERWAVDLGAEDYNITNVGGVALEDTYRRRAEGHNIPVINPGAGFNQRSDMFVDINKHEYNEYGGYVVADMTGVYADTTAMKTGYYVGSNYRSATIRHEIDFSKKSTMYWFMHTKADIMVDGNTAYMSKNGKSIKIEVSTSAGTPVLSVMDALPLPTSPNPSSQNQNDGYRKLAVNVSDVEGHLDLVIRITPMGEAVAECPEAEKPISEWVLPSAPATSGSGAPNLNFKIYSDGELVTSALPCFQGMGMPNIEVVPEDPANTIVEVQQAQSSSETTIVRVYDKSKKYCNMGLVTYFDVVGTSIKLFDKIPAESVKVSSEPQVENAAINMLDGSFATRWTCMAKGEWAVFDLGSVQDIDGVALAFWKGDIRSYFFKLQVSVDGKTFQDVLVDVESNGQSEGYEVFDFDRTQARYIKFIGAGNSEATASGVNSNILEFTALRKKY